MKRLYLISPFAAFLLLLTFTLTVSPGITLAEDAHIFKRQVSINKKDQNLIQIIEALAYQAEVTIDIHGRIPAEKKDILLNNVPLNEAMAQVLDLYGVKNHAIAYNSEAGTAMLAILGISAYVVPLPADKPTDMGVSRAEILQRIHGETQ